MNSPSLPEAGGWTATALSNCNYSVSDPGLSWPPAAVAEIQGLYGPLTISERLVQRLWLRQEWAGESLRTTEGGVLRVIFPGRWNRQEGPDFLDAELEIDGRRVVGDVEVHFHRQDWTAHGHGQNPAFARVMLHVVLFPDRGGPNVVIQCADGRQPATLVLLPCLNADLEECVNREIREEGAGLQNRVTAWLERPPEIRWQHLRQRALLRWDQKVRFARQRLAGGGWDEVCHQYALEVLGYRRNRAPMSNLAQLYPLADWAGLNRTPAALMNDAGPWKLAGLRPPNHPAKRLAQYQAWVRQVPAWPQVLAEWGSGLPRLGATRVPAPGLRRKWHFDKIRGTLAEKVCGRVLSGPRLDTLIVDAFFPLLSVRMERDFFAWWWNWPAGDHPPAFDQFLRGMAWTKATGEPIGNGALQGSLQVFLEEGN